MTHDEDEHTHQHNHDHEHSDGTQHAVSRRDLLKRVGAAAAGVVVVGAGVAPSASAAEAPAMSGMSMPGMPAGEAAEALQALETLNAAEADALRAVVARIIPTDENGPGAAEAHAAHYIDRALNGPLAGSRAAYAAGLAALDDYSMKSKGKAFASLAAKDQDAVLTDLEKNVATGFAPNAATFFNLVRGHTLQGTFGDPYYGGNAGYVGWDMLGYPGLRMSVAAADQKLAKPAAVRASAYSDDQFTMKGTSYGH